MLRRVWLLVPFILSACGASEGAPGFITEKWDGEGVCTLIVNASIIPDHDATRGECKGIEASVRTNANEVLSAGIVGYRTIDAKALYRNPAAPAPDRPGPIYTVLAPHPCGQIEGVRVHRCASYNMPSRL
jgi:hypothetical protein